MPAVPAPTPTPQPGQPPFGSSPATGPTRNQGFQAQGVAGLALVVTQLEKLVPLLGAGSEAGQDVLDALRKLSKHIPPGTVSPQAQQNQLQQLMLRRAQMQGMPQPAQAPAAPSPTSAAA